METGVLSKGGVMAITRVSGAQILQTYAGTIAPSLDFESYALQRLDNGRMAAVWKSQAGSTATLNVSTLDPLGLYAYVHSGA